MAFQPAALNLPPYPFKIKQEGDKYYIFDDIRKKHLLITPEEWVRQHFIQYLIQQKQVPKALINIEGGLVLNSLQKRSDIVIYSRTGEKLLLVECKAPSIKIAQHVFDQAARYNSVYKAKWLVVTNGLQHYYCIIDHNKPSFVFMEELPLFSQW